MRMRNRAASPACADGRQSSPVTPQPCAYDSQWANPLGRFFSLCGCRSSKLGGRSLSSFTAVIANVAESALNSALGIPSPVVA